MLSSEYLIGNWYCRCLGESWPLTIVITPFLWTNAYFPDHLLEWCVGRIRETSQYFVNYGLSVKHTCTSQSFSVADSFRYGSACQTWKPPAQHTLNIWRPFSPMIRIFLCGNLVNLEQPKAEEQLSSSLSFQNLKIIPLKSYYWTADLIYRQYNLISRFPPQFSTPHHPISI